MTDLTELRRIAEAATPGPWRHVETAWGESVEVDDGQLFIEQYGVTYAWNGDNAAHIATFDPPTVLVLLDRLESAEKTIEAVREAARYGSRMDANPTRMGAETVADEWAWWQSWHLRADAAWRKNIRDALAGYEQTTNHEDGRDR